MDELAIKLGMDPVQLRLLNEPSLDEGWGLPFSSRHFQECMTVGADRFGWAKRDAKIGSMKRDGLTLGWGMAACSWLAARFDCTASVELRDDGTVRVASAVQDIGTGTYTAMAQITAEMLGVDVEKVEVALGDTNLPAGPLSGGSMLTSSLISADQPGDRCGGRQAHRSCRIQQRQVLQRCQADRSAIQQRTDRSPGRRLIVTQVR